jgi:hypothetical protein
MHWFGIFFYSAGASGNGLIPIYILITMDRAIGPSGFLGLEVCIKIVCLDL